MQANFQPRKYGLSEKHKVMSDVIYWKTLHFSVQWKAFSSSLKLLEIGPRNIFICHAARKPSDTGNFFFQALTLTLLEIALKKPEWELEEYSVADKFTNKQ